MDEAKKTAVLARLDELTDAMKNAQAKLIEEDGATEGEADFNEGAWHGLNLALLAVSIVRSNTLRDVYND